MSVILSVGNIPRPSLWDKPTVADGTLKDLRGKVFKMIGARLRAVTTVYGDKNAVDIVVEIDGERFTYSGFSAGIQAQLRSASNGDFPTFATVEEIAVKNGVTMSLVPVREGEGDPLTAPERDEQTQLAAATDDDLPF